MATKLVSMKISKKASTEKLAQAMPSDGDQPAYPYGLELHLGNDELKKLGVEADEYAAGDELMILAKVKVSRTSTQDHLVGGPSASLDLQITDLCFEEKPAATAQAKTATRAAGKLYP